MSDAAERRAKEASSAVESSSAVDPPIAASEVAVTPAPDLDALATLLAGKEMTEEQRAEIVAPLMQSLQKIMPNAMQAFAVKQFVEWMHLKIGVDALLDLATYSEPARVEEYKARIMKWATICVDANAMQPHETAMKADHDAAKREALTGIGHCIFCLLYTSPSPRYTTRSRMPSST